MVNSPIQLLHLSMCDSTIFPRRPLNPARSVEGFNGSNPSFREVDGRIVGHGAARGAVGFVAVSLVQFVLFAHVSSCGRVSSR